MLNSSNNRGAYVFWLSGPAGETGGAWDMSSSRRASSATEGPDDLQSLSDSVADELTEIEHDEDTPANQP